MSARTPQCPVCGEERELRVLDYVPPVENGAAALVRYECLVDGVIVEHWTNPVGPEVLERFGYSV